MKDTPAFNTDMALAYDTTTRISIPSYDALFTMVQAYFRANLGDQAASLLVVGAGGGNELTAWGPSNSKWTFTGVDPAAEMLKIAQGKAAQLGMESRVRLIQGTVEEMPHSDGQFDAGSCILVLHFIAGDQAKGELLGAIKARLKPGAPFVLVSACGNPAEAEFHNRLEVWKTFWLQGGHTPDKVAEMGNSIVTRLSLLPDQQIEALLAEAGFARITRFWATGIFAGWVCHAK